MESMNQSSPYLPKRSANLFAIQAARYVVAPYVLPGYMLTDQKGRSHLFLDCLIAELPDGLS